MGPLQSLPRWFTFAVGLASTLIALLGVSDLVPPGSVGAKLLAVAAGVCTWLATVGRSLLTTPPAADELRVALDALADARAQLTVLRAQLAAIHEEKTAP